mgnify:CR=1 FL=1
MRGVSRADGRNRRKEKSGVKVVPDLEREESQRRDKEKMEAKLVGKKEVKYHLNQ